MDLKTKKDKRKNAEVSIRGTLPKEHIIAHKEKALARIQKEIEIQGFRKGHAPLERVKEYVGEKALWRESGELALKAEVENILKEHEVLPILLVSANLVSGDPDLDIPFEIIAVVAPTCSIENYKQSAEMGAVKTMAFDEAKEKDLALSALRAQARATIQKKEETEFTDEEAKKLGMENAKAFEFFLEGEAERAVKERALQKKRGAIVEALIEKATCDIPLVIIRDEARALLDATKKDIARQGIPFNDYLKRTGKTEETILAELMSPAEKRVALDLIFGNIARTENIKPDEKEEETLVHALMNQGAPEDQAHAYAKSVILREKVWELLGAKSASQKV